MRSFLSKIIPSLGPLLAPWRGPNPHSHQFPKYQSTQSSHSHLVQPITIRTGSSGLYQQLHKQHPRLYPANSPPTGIDLTTNYLDTHPNRSTHTQTIVAIHGTPGTHQHFDSIVAHFTQHHPNVRLIAPSLPDFTHTRSSGGIWWNSTLEKVDFVKALLERVGVQKIDCLIGHSFGVHTLAGLWEQPNPLQIGSLALFSPQPLYDKTPFNLSLRRALLTFKSEFWFNFLEKTRIHTSSIWPMRFTSVNELLLLTSGTLGHWNPLDLRRRIHFLMEESQIPLTIMYGSKEALISREAIARLYGELEIPQEEVILLNPKKDSIERIKSDPRKRFQAYEIEGGGHFAYAKYGLLSSKMIENLLSHTKHEA